MNPIVTAAISKRRGGGLDDLKPAIVNMIHRGALTTGYDHTGTPVAYAPPRPEIDLADVTMRGAADLVAQALVSKYGKTGADIVAKQIAAKCGDQHD